MNRAPNLPYAEEIDDLSRDPMAWLARWRDALGALYALPVEGALLSRTPDCSGVVAVFGEAHQRAVLTDIETFVLPPSAAVHLRLPPALHTLNAGLHGMRGSEHERHKQLLARVLAGADPERVHAAAERAAAAVCADLVDGGALLASMRRLALDASSRLFFGDDGAALVSAAGLMDYFQRRREAAAPGRIVAADERAQLIEAGERADAQLRTYRRAARADGASDTFGALAALARAPDTVLDEDGFVGHANVLFISCNEPIAVALTWTLLALSQQPLLRARCHDAAQRIGDAYEGEGQGDGRLRAASPLIETMHAQKVHAQKVHAQAQHAQAQHAQKAYAQKMLIEHVLDESLRVLTPNALMVRVTRTPTRLGAYRLPAGCEVLLSPFLSHRDSQLFPQPQRFLPSRWANSRPSPYAYFPFGAGGHGCVGRGLSLRLLRDCLVALMRHGEIVLDGDAVVDWRVHVMLMPTHDPRVRLFAGALGEAMCGGVLKGGVCDIVDFADEDDGEYDGS